MQWAAVLADTSLENLPYKIELTSWGDIEMSPVTNKHGLLRTEVAFLLRKHLPLGRIITECAIQTANGVKVADAVWGSKAFFHRQPLDQDPFNYAPEICIEIVSPGNSTKEMHKKIHLYLQHGATEVWLVDLLGQVRIYTLAGEVNTSNFAIPKSAWDDLANCML